MSSRFFNGGSAVKRASYEQLQGNQNNSIVANLLWEFYNTENIIKPINDREVYIPNRLTVYDLNILSDERHKRNIISIMNHDIKYLNKLVPKQYIMNNEYHYGFIAQEVEKYYPYLVNTNVLGEKTMKYHELIPLLLKKINYLEERVERLERSAGK